MSKFPFLTRALRRIARLRSRAPHPAQAETAWDPQIPAMLTPDEIVFYRECAAALAGREGAIVDLGCWLGGSSIALAQGLSRRARDTGFGEKVIAFDLFVWEGWMPSTVPYCIYEPGESFLPEARRLTRDHARDKVRLISADLRTYQWNGGPIKILLVDAMKSEELTRQIARNFFPSLASGSLLIHQDFKHFHTSWIHLLQYQLRDRFRLHHSVPKSGTAAFEVIVPISTELLNRATDFSRLADAQIDTCFRHSIDVLGRDECENVAAAHIMHYLHLGRKARARETLQMYGDLQISEEGELSKVLRRLA